MNLLRCLVIWVFSDDCVKPLKFCVFAVIRNFLTAYIQFTQLIYGKYDEVGVVAFGTTGISHDIFIDAVISQLCAIFFISIAVIESVVLEFQILKMT